MEPNNNNTDGNSRPRPGKFRWVRRLLGGLLLLVMLLGIALLWVVNDTERTRVFVENLVTNLTDRSFQINGEFDFTLGSEITVTANEIVWANAHWSSQPTMLTVENAEASISLSSLLSPPILISNAVASNARLDFEWNDENKSNWYLVKADKPPRTEPLHPLPLLLDKADLRNVELHFKHPALTEELVILLEKAIQVQDEENRLVPEIDAVFDGRKVEIDGRIGPFPELVIAGAVDFDVTAVGPNARLRINGDFANLKELRDPNLELLFEAPEIERILDILNLPEVTRGNASLKGQLVSDAGALDGDIKGVIGEFNLDGEFHATSLKDLAGVTARLQSDGPSAAAAFAPLGLRGMPDEAYTLSLRADDTPEGLKIEEFKFSNAGATLAATGLISDFPVLANLDLQLQLEVPDLSPFGGLLPGDVVPALPFTLDTQIESNTSDNDDSLTAIAKLGGIDAEATGLLTENPGFAGSKLDFALQVPDGQKLGDMLGVTLLRQEKLSIAGDLLIETSSIAIDANNISVGSNTGTAKITLPLGAEQTELALNTSLRGDNLADVVSLFAETDRAPALPYDVSGKLRFAGNNLGLESMRGKIGKTSFSTNGQLAFGAGFPSIDLNIKANGPDLNEPLASQGIEGAPAKAFDVSTRLKISADEIQLSNLDFGTSDDTITGDIRIGGLRESLDVDFDVVANGANLQAIAPDIPAYTPAAVRFKIQAKGSWTESTIDMPRLSVQLGSSSIDLSGTLELPPALQAKDVRIKASGASMLDLGTIEDWPFRDVPFEVTATMSGTRNRADISDLRAIVGPSDLRGRFLLDLTNKPTVELRLESELLDIRPLQARLNEETEAEIETETEDLEKNDDGRLIPDAELPVDLLNSFDATVDIDIRKVVSRRVDLGTVKLDGKLQNGTLAISRFAADTEKGNLESEVHLRPVANRHEVEVKATANNLVIAIGGLDDKMRQDHPGQNIDLHLTAAGNNYRDLAASLNGFLWLRGGERKVAADQIGFLFGDFLTEVFTTINPFAEKEPYQTMECDRMFFEAVDGVIQTAPAVFFRTDKLNMTSVGAINLHTEKLDFGIETSPRKGIGLSAGDLVNPFVKISGTLSKPGLTMDPTGTLIEGGAAVATMGLTIVAKSMYKRWLGPRKPCQKITEDAFKIRTARDPANVPVD